MTAASHHHHIKDRDREGPVNRALLWHITDVAMAAVAIFAIDGNMPFRKWQYADNGFEKRAFAGTVGPNNRDTLARFYREMDIVQRVTVAWVTGRQVVNLQGGLIRPGLSRGMMESKFDHESPTWIQSPSRE